MKMALLFLVLSMPCWGVESSAGAGPKERTVSALEENLKRDPANHELWLHLGFAYRKTGQIDEAQKAFEKATSLNPKEANAYYMLGLIYESKHMTMDAKKAWQNYFALETDPEKRAVAEKHIHHLSQ